MKDLCFSEETIEGRVEKLVVVTGDLSAQNERKFQGYFSRRIETNKTPFGIYLRLGDILASSLARSLLYVKGLCDENRTKAFVTHSDEDKAKYNPLNISGINMVIEVFPHSRLKYFLTSQNSSSLSS